MVDFNKVKELVEAVKENFVEFVNNKKVDQKVVVEETMNMPAIKKYMVALYQDGKLLEEKELAEAGTVTFDGLESRTTYTVEVYAVNAVGYSDYVDMEVTTKSGSSGGSSSSSSSSSSKKDIDETVEDTEETTEETKDTTESEEKESTFSSDAVERFEDVKASDWYAKAVSYVYDEGIMGGVEVDEFGAYMTTTRAMMWTILARMDGVDTSKGDTWYTAGREWTMKNGISDGTAPMNNITREQLASMLYRYAQFKGMDMATLEENLGQFTDAAQISEYAVQAMNWAVGEGVMSGNGNGTLNAKGNATRAHAAQMLMNFMK